MNLNMKGLELQRFFKKNYQGLWELVDKAKQRYLLSRDQCLGLVFSLFYYSVAVL